jgi:peptidoglycan/LPS O-acetylase OafA/YrhL
MIPSTLPTPATLAPPKGESFYIPSLDGIRAAAVLLVFVAHAGLNERVPGNFGVTVFFFLSGYLITTLLRVEFERTGSISFRAFYLRRVLRILPPMYVVLALASALTFVGALEGTLQLDALLWQVFHLSNYYVILAGWWDGRAPGTWIYWSLAVEEHFYLLFPVFYLILLRCVPSRRRQMLMLLALCAIVLAWRCLLVFGFDAIKERTYVASDTRVDSILFGCILAVYGNPMLDPCRIAERWWKYLWLPLSAAVLLITFVVLDPRFQQTFRYTLQGLALFALFVVAVRYPDWGPCRVLNLRWVRFLGVLSYSLYLVHPTILFGLHQWLPGHPVLLGILGLGLSVLLSTAIYHVIEKPCAALRKRLSRLGRTTQREAAAREAPSPALRASGPLPTVTETRSLSARTRA